MMDQETIINALGVCSALDAAREAQRRTEFLAGYLREAGLEAYVLGISGGVDSLAAAMLAQRAVRGLRHTGYDATFIACGFHTGYKRTRPMLRPRSTRSAPTVCCEST